MKVIKSNGELADFDRSEIVADIKLANDEVAKFAPRKVISASSLSQIINKIYERCRKRTGDTSVEEIRDMLELELMKERAYEVARCYIKQRCNNKKPEDEIKDKDVITLYSQDGCVKCKELHMLLDMFKVKYVTNTDVDYMIKQAFMQTPVLEVNGKFMYFEEAKEWISNNFGGKE